MAHLRSMLRGLLSLTLLLLPFGAAAQDMLPGPGARLRPGDIVRVEIWREEDLSGEFHVDESGTVTLPLLGERRVAGVMFSELRDALLADYRAELRNPSILITPLRRIYILGDVNSPGPQSIDPTISLAGAIALAGGASSEGDLRRIRVVRDGQIVLDRVSAESALSGIDIRSGDQVFVGRRSWFDRNSTFLVSATLSVASIVISLVR